MSFKSELFGDLWDQFFSGQLSVKKRHVTETSLERLAVALSHLDAGGTLPRRLPCEYRNNDNSMFNGTDLWLLFHSDFGDRDKMKVFKDLMDAKSLSVVYFLENWIETCKLDHDSIRTIAKAV